MPDGETSDGRFTEDAISFLATTDEPFFLGVGYIRTHVPWYVPLNTSTCILPRTN